MAKQPKKQFDTLMAVRDNFLQEVTNYCLLGSTDAQLSEFFQVELATIQAWYKLQPAYRAAVDKGRIAADARVAGAIFRRAEGFVVEEEQLMTVGLGKGQTAIRRVKVNKHYPPDVSAGKYWLNNRSRNWNEKQTHEHTGPDGGAIESELTIRFVATTEETITLPASDFKEITQDEPDPAND